METHHADRLADPLLQGTQHDSHNRTNFWRFWPRLTGENAGPTGFTPQRETDEVSIDILRKESASELWEGLANGIANGQDHNRAGLLNGGERDERTSRAGRLGDSFIGSEDDGDEDDASSGFLLSGPAELDSDTSDFDDDYQSDSEENRFPHDEMDFGACLSKEFLSELGSKFRNLNYRRTSKLSVGKIGHWVERTLLTVQGLSCANCAKVIEDKMYSLDGVVAAACNLVFGNVVVVHDASWIPASRLSDEIDSIGYVTSSCRRMGIEESGTEVSCIAQRDTASVSLLMADSFDKPRIPPTARHRIVAAKVNTAKATLSEMEGVIQSVFSEGLIRIVYDAGTIGARTILANLQESGVDVVHYSTESRRLLSRSQGHGFTSAAFRSQISRNSQVSAVLPNAPYEGVELHPNHVSTPASTFYDESHASFGRRPTATSCHGAPSPAKNMNHVAAVTAPGTRYSSFLMTASPPCSTISEGRASYIEPKGVRNSLHSSFLCGVNDDIGRSGGAASSSVTESVTRSAAVAQCCQTTSYVPLSDSNGTKPFIRINTDVEDKTEIDSHQDRDDIQHHTSESNNNVGRDTKILNSSDARNRNKNN
eukprot:Lankesteria_metandrocarpae@DN2315_c0_g1_i1.p1